MNNNHITIQDKSRCCGCGACANICPCDAITVSADEYGFGYPSVNADRCVGCSKCVSVCDFTDLKNNGVLPVNAYAAVNKSKDVLSASSSGGVFSALAEVVLEKGGAVCGCVFDDKLRPVHICSEKLQDVVRMCRSKYVQSDIGFVYREVATHLGSGRTVLFTGTPCQVAALYEFLGKKEVDNLITVDLVCHGVPSELLFQKFVEYLERKYRTKIVNFNFRSKKFGWQRYSLEFTGADGRVRNIGKENEFYLPAFSAGFTVRPSCFSCKYACPERVGDFTIGDFWGHEKTDVYRKTEKGVSLCTFNTERAMELLSFLEDKLLLKKIDYKIAVEGNTNLRQPMLKGNKWDQYMEAVKADDIDSIAEGYIKKNKSKILRSKLKLRVPYGVFSWVRKKKYGKRV